MNRNNLDDTVCAAITNALAYRSLNLDVLKLDDNPIYSVGVEFLATRRVVDFAFGFATLAWPPPTVSSQGRNAVYAFLDAAYRDCIPLMRSRLMFVGNGGAGKTTLKTALHLQMPTSRSALQELQKARADIVARTWRVADLARWVDDLAQQQHFFERCQGARGMNGKDFLQCSPVDIARIFGADKSPAARRVVDKMVRVLNFLNPDATRAMREETTAGEDSTGSLWWWWWPGLERALADTVAALEGVDMRSLSAGPDGVPALDSTSDNHTLIPYSVLLDIPHVWTEGVELDTEPCEGYTLWDFPGQLEMYPAHRLFLASDTAVYVLVVDGALGALPPCLAQLNRWLSLIRSGMHRGSANVEVRIVVTHTDELLPERRQVLLLELHDHAKIKFGDRVSFGLRCYATVYAAEDGGDLDGDAGLLAELRRLRTMPVHQTQRMLPATYQAVCTDAIRLARDLGDWPLVPITSIDTRGEDGSILFAALEDLGFLRRVGDNDVVVGPVEWLSKLMAAFLDPRDGLAHRMGSTAEATAKGHSEHIAAVLVRAEEACHMVNLRRKIVAAEHAHEVLPLLAQFDICFCPFRDGEYGWRYVFPVLLPRIDAAPEWLAAVLSGSFDGRRYKCVRPEDLVPSTLASLLMQRLFYLDTGRGQPVFLGCGTAVVKFDEASFAGVHLTDDDRAIDVFAFGTS